MLTKCAGTLGYMAPEVFGARPYDGRSADVFSIGAVMHHMVVGVPPSWKASKEAYDFPGKVRYQQLSDTWQGWYVGWWWIPQQLSGLFDVAELE